MTDETVNKKMLKAYKLALKFDQSRRFTLHLRPSSDHIQAPAFVYLDSIYNLAQNLLSFGTELTSDQADIWHHFSRAKTHWALVLFALADPGAVALWAAA